MLAAVEQRPRGGVGVSAPAALPGTEDHPHARMVLASALASGAPSHAYLFHGPPGTGKRAAARALAAELLAEGAPDPDNVRRRVEHGTHPDLTWVMPDRRARDARRRRRGAGRRRPPRARRSSRASGCSCSSAWTR